MFANRPLATSSSALIVSAGGIADFSDMSARMIVDPSGRGEHGLFPHDAWYELGAAWRLRRRLRSTRPRASHGKRRHPLLSLLPRVFRGRGSVSGARASARSLREIAPGP